MEFAFLQREAEVVHVGDGPKHGGMATPFSQFHLLLMTYAFTAAEYYRNVLCALVNLTNAPRQRGGGS